MNQFIIVVFTIAIAVSHLILLSRIRYLSNLLNLQGSELNKYSTLFGENALVYINEQEYIQRQLIEEVMELINENGLTYQQALLIKDILKENVNDTNAS